MTPLVERGLDLLDHGAASPAVATALKPSMPVPESRPTSPAFRGVSTNAPIPDFAVIATRCFAV